jgi:hypothetical protein
MAPNGSVEAVGAPSARPIGRRMSGIESWAMVAPSRNSTIAWITDCGCTTTSIAVEVDAEQLVRLDDLEALVHERRRVDRDLGAHVQVGCCSASATVTRRARSRCAAERPAAGGEHEPAHLVARRPRRHW